MQLLRVVAADDEADLVLFYEKVLTRLGYDVAVARDGLELLALCQGRSIDLIITDINMPRIGGIEVVQQVCEQKPVPVILASAIGAAEVAWRVAEAFPFIYLPKPVSAASLKNAIALAMGPAAS